MNTLQLRYAIIDDAVTLRPLIDGVDVLDDYVNSQGRDPNHLLPPLSTRLFPARGAHRVIIGVCSCGETGCGSLEMSVRRSGNEVLWEPVEAAKDETLRRPYQFDLRAYLDAVDGAAGDPPAGEGLGRRVARDVRMRLGMYDQRHESMTMFHRATIDWISAWPWNSPVVKASVTSSAGQSVHEFTLQRDESEDRFAARIATELARLRLPTDRQVPTHLPVRLAETAGRVGRTK